MDEKTKKLITATGLFGHKKHSYLMYLRQNFDMNELLDIAIDSIRSMRRPDDFTGLSNDDYFADKFNRDDPDSDD